LPPPSEEIAGSKIAPADHAANQAAVPRRSRGKPAAFRRKQEEIGLRSVTDGEFRRAFWNYDFLGKLSGVEAYLGERKIKFQGPQPKPMMLRVIGKTAPTTRIR